MRDLLLLLLFIYGIYGFNLTTTDEFIPTNEFQTIHPDQPIPPGLLIRLNLETGSKEAKLLPKEDSTKPSDLTEIQNLKTTFTTLAEQRGLTAEEKETLDTILSDLWKDPTEILHQLKHLEHIVHDGDVGLELIQSRGFSRLIELLSHAQADIRVFTALVIGNALSNNPAGQHAALDTNLLSLLVQKLQRDEASDVVIPKLFFVLSHLIRSNKRGLIDFYENQGVSLLMYLNQNPNLKPKVHVLLQDLLDKDMFPELIYNEKELMDKKYWNQDAILFWCLETKNDDFKAIFARTFTC